MSEAISDIIILGAGLIGTSQAVALKNQGFRIHVLEHHLPEVTTQAKKDTRPLALSYASVVILQQLGVWDGFAEKACPIRAVHVSDHGALGSLRFRADEMRVPALGYVVPFSDLQEALYRSAAAQEGVEFVPIQEITAINCEATGATVKVNTVHGAREFRASLLIAADGTKSTARHMMNIATEEKDYHEVALTGLITLNEKHEGTAFERFTKEGTLALLPLPSHNQYRLVWTLPKSHADEISAGTDEALLKKIQYYFRGYVNDMRSLERESQYPLKTVVSAEQIRPGFVLLGNAAHTLYPVAAQGFNLGLRDVAVLSEVLADAEKHVKRLGDLSVLQQYLEWRVNDQKRVSQLTQGITHVFGLHLPLMRRIRGMGLLATELFSPLKKRLARQMMGVAGRVPRLARGIDIE